MNDERRDRLIAALRKAIHDREQDWQNDPECKRLMEEFRSFAEEYDLDLNTVLHAGSGQGRPMPGQPQPFSPQRVEQLLRLIQATQQGTAGLTQDRRAALERELADARRTLAALQGHEQLIRHGVSPYSEISRRLKAQRALRELPGRIKELERRLQELE